MLGNIRVFTPEKHSARAARRIQGDDVGAGHDAGAGVAQRGGDVHALVAFLPQADHGHVDAALDRGNVGQTLAANRGGATDLGGAGDLRHRLGVAHGLARVRLDGDDELALQVCNERVHGELLCGQEE